MNKFDFIKLLNKLIYLIILFFLFYPILNDMFDFEDIQTDFDYARITDVDYKAEVLDNKNNGGDVKVTEILTFDIHAASKDNLFWELWRDLPEDNVDGLKVNYDVISVKQIHDNGYKEVYTESPRLYWEDYDYTSSSLGPGKWFHSVGPYNENTADYEAVFFYVDGLYREKITFELQYIIHNAALKYNDISELYLTMFSENSVNYLNSFKGEILINNNDMPKKGNYEVHTLGTKNESFEIKESTTKNPGYHTFYFDLSNKDLKFKKYNEYLDFILWSYGNDKHKFTNYAPNNYYSNENALDEIKQDYYNTLSKPAIYKEKKINCLSLSIILSIIIIIYTNTRKKYYTSKYNFFKPQQKIIYFRDIPSDLDPYFVSNFILCKSNKKYNEETGYSAVLLNLIRKGYIKIENDQNNCMNIKILYINPITTNQQNTFNNSFSNNQLKTIPNTPLTIQQINENITTIKYNIEGKKLEDLTLSEQYYFNLIVKYSFSNQISMDGFQIKLYNNPISTESFVKDMNKSIITNGINKGYFQKSKYDEIKIHMNNIAFNYKIFAIILLISNLFIKNTRLDLAFGAFIILPITLYLCSRKLKSIANKYILLTQLGEDEYAKWKGLYDYLNSETLMNEKTYIELPLWEKYLVYSTAFGISEKVIKALKIKCPDIELSPMLSNNYYTSTSFRHSNHSFSSAVRSSSYHSSGSYYGGGGRGGGGGGGGH